MSKNKNGKGLEPEEKKSLHRISDENNKEKNIGQVKQNDKSSKEKPVKSFFTNIASKAKNKTEQIKVSKDVKQDKEKNEVQPVSLGERPKPEKKENIQRRANTPKELSKEEFLEKVGQPKQSNNKTMVAARPNDEKEKNGMNDKTAIAKRAPDNIAMHEKEANNTASGKKKNKKEKHKVKKGKLVKYILLNMVKAGVFVLCMGIIVGVISVTVVFQYVVAETNKNENILNLENIKLNYTSYIYAKNPETGLWEEYEELIGNEHRIWVNLDQIPDNLVHAVVATEDREFYEHKGVNFRRTIYAAANEFLAFEDKSFGASTITQQLVKNLTGDDEVDYMRKVREMIRAMVLNQNYSKDMVMEAYLNTMGLSERLAGVQAGAKEYFDKDVSELTLWECATIAGVTQYPSLYSPFRNPDECLKRRDNVLLFMNQAGYITEAEMKHAWQQPLGVVDKSNRTEEEKKADATFSYFTDVVFEQVVEDLQKEYNWTRSRAIEEVYTGGLRIYATVDLEMQAILEDMYYNGYEEEGYFFTHFDQFGVGSYEQSLKIIEDVNNEAGNKIGEREVLPQSAVSVVRTSDGSLAACIGGIGQKEGKLGLNRATQSPRQVGSTIKPIGPYSIALDTGVITYSTGVLDEAVQPKNPNKPNRGEGGAVVNDWPSNVTKKYRHYPIPVVSAISESTNTVAVRVGQMVGLLPIFEFMSETLQISTLVDTGDPSDLGLAPLCLGSLTEGITTYEMAGAYTIFGNGGTFNSLHTYEKVTDANGKVVLRPDNRSSQAISEESAFIMNKILSTVMLSNAPNVSGTGYNYRLDNDVEAVGKTGTTNDDRDRWFIGVTPEFSTAVWWGYDMKHTFWPDGQRRKWPVGRANVPGNIWKSIMDQYYESHESGEFPEQPEGVVEKRFCISSGDLAGPGCGSAVGYYNMEFESDLNVCRFHSGGGAAEGEEG